MDHDAFTTSDLNTAALLLASPGITFDGISNAEPQRCTFRFKPKVKATRISIDFINGTVLVNARSFTDSLRHCKNILFEKERKDRGARPWTSQAKI